MVDVVEARPGEPGFDRLGTGARLGVKWTEAERMRREGYPLRGVAMVIVWWVVVLLCNCRGTNTMNE